MVLYQSIGRLSYRNEGKSYGLIVKVDQGISEFYKSLIPKYNEFIQQKYPAHITVIRIHREIPPKMEHWGKYEGKKITFSYSPMLHQGTVYWWLNAFSTRLEEVRAELGLPVISEYTLPPEGFVKCFHITLANKKK